MYSDIKPISNHPRIPLVDGQPILRYIQYRGHGHDEDLKIIQIRVSRFHRIEKDKVEIPLPKIAPDDVVILEANMQNYVDMTGTRVQLIPDKLDQDGNIVIPAHYPDGSIPEYIFWHYAFEQPQVLWSTIEYNIVDQGNKGAYDKYEY